MSAPGLRQKRSKGTDLSAFISDSSANPAGWAGLALQPINVIAKSNMSGTIPRAIRRLTRCVIGWTPVEEREVYGAARRGYQFRKTNRQGEVRAPPRPARRR